MQTRTNSWCLHQTLRSRAAERKSDAPVIEHTWSLSLSLLELRTINCSILIAKIENYIMSHMRAIWLSQMGLRGRVRVASRRIAKAPVGSWVVKRNCTWRKRHFLPLCTATKIIELSLHDAMTDYCYSRKYPGVYSTSRALHHSRYSAVSPLYKFSKLMYCVCALGIFTISH